MTSINLHHDNFAHTNDTSLLQRDANSLISTQQDQDFLIAAYYVDKNYSRKQYIYYGHLVILINFYKDLMYMELVYVPVSGFIQQGINNLTRNILTLEHPGDPASTNDASYINFQNNDEVDGNHQISSSETHYDQDKVILGFNITDVIKAK